MESFEQEPPIERRQRIAVWAGCLAAYNAGRLHGDWLDADVEPGELWEGVKKVIDTSPAWDAEEHFWADHEGFQGIRIGEYDTVERITTLAKLVAEHGEAFARWYENDTSVELEALAEQFEEAYIGTFDDEGELETHLCDSMDIEAVMQDAYKCVPGWMQVYVQFDSAGYLRDLQLNGDMFTARGSGGLFAYWGNR